MISVENRKIFPPPCILHPRRRGFPLELVIGARSKKNYNDGATEPRTLTTSSAVWIQYTNVTDRQTDGRTDGRTDIGRQQRQRLRIALRGKSDLNVRDLIRLRLKNKAGS